MVQKNKSGKVEKFIFFMQFSLIFLLAFGSPPLYAKSPSFRESSSFQKEIQKRTKSEKLLKISGELRKKQQQDREKARSLATQKGWMLKKIEKSGRIVELMRLDSRGKPLYYTTMNENAAKTVSTNHVWPGGASGLSLSGNGWLIGEWDGGAVLETHQEFTGRVVMKDDTATTHYHSTHVAGTLIASGLSSAARGMAYEANLDAYDWTFDESEMAAAGAAGLTISNHSYGYITGWLYDSQTNEYTWYGDPDISVTEDWHFGFYNYSDMEWDTIASNAPNYLIVKSAGNDRSDSGPSSGGLFYYFDSDGTRSPATFSAPPQDGGADGYDTINGGAVAKNILTVGSVDDIPAGYTHPSEIQIAPYSNWGPTDDGRIKPDIVANGQNLYSTMNSSDSAYAELSGTSMASPSAAGSLALLQQHYYTTHQNQLMLSSTLKALAIHTADEAGDYDGPDYQHGWGLLNTAAAAEVISGDGSTGHFIGEKNLAESSSFVLDVTSDGSEPLVVTICWTDEPGTPVEAALDPANIMLVNDLDLRITGNGTTSFPWILDPANPADPATTGDNFRDTVEKITIENPVAGTYSIEIGHKGALASGSQLFAIIVSGIAAASPHPLIISDINPISGPSAGGTDVSISGNGFGNIQGTGTVTFDGMNALIQSWTNNSIQATAPAHQDGKVDIAVTSDNGLTSDVAFEAFTYGSQSTHTISSSDLPKNIEDNATVSSSLNITTSGTIVDLDVGLTISHTYLSDLSIYLISPNGTRVALSLHNGESGANYTGTIFDDEADQAISSGIPPFTGSYQPSGDLSLLDGLDAAGTWILEINDGGDGDTGTLEAWHLKFTGLFFSDPDTHTITAGAEANGTITPSGKVPANDGDELLFTILPDADYEIGNVSVDGVSQGPVPSYTFSNITSDHTISASFLHKPAIAVSTPGLSAMCLPGFDPVPQSFEVWNAGDQTLNYTVSDNETWLEVGPLSGTSTGEHDTISVNYMTAALSEGNYTATITISDPGAQAAPKTVTVDLTIASAQQFPYIESFEADTGLWQSPDYYDFNWTRHSGSTSSADTGPAGAQDGTYYMYTEASDPNFPSKVAVLQAGINLTSLSVPLLTFHYHMRGDTMGGLYLEASLDGGAIWTELWSITGDQGNIWHSGPVVDLSAYNTSQTQIRFRAITGESFNSDIAIDNVIIREDSPVINMTPMSLSLMSPEGNTVPAGSMEVWNGGSGTLNYSISDDAAWLEVSPPAGSSTGGHESFTINYSTAALPIGAYTAAITIADPMAFPATKTIPVYLTIFPSVQSSYTESFESDTGSWHANSSFDFNWTRLSGSTPSPNTGPSGARDGTYFMYTEATDHNPAWTAVLESAFDLSSLVHPVMDFNYHMYGSSMGSLFLEASMDGRTTWDTLWSMSENQGNTWNQVVSVDLSPYNTASTIIRFRGITGTGFTSDMAIDYISIREIMPVLTVSMAGSGAGNVISSPAGIDCGIDCAEPYGDGTVVTLNATAAAQSAFSGWSGDMDCLDGIVTMTEDINCTAIFESTVNTIMASAGANGSITPSGTVTVTKNTDQIFTIEPDPDYEIEDVLVDDISVGAVPTYVFPDVTADHTISATFIHKPYIALSTSSLSAICMQGHAPAPQSLEVWNAGSRTLSFDVSDNAAWLDVNPPSGTSAGEPTTISVNYLATTLSEGNYTATITISDSLALAPPETVQVLLAVLSAQQFPYIESFEIDTGIEQITSGFDFNWTRNSGSTVSSTTGPTGAQDGTYYMYTEASDPNFPFKTAVLQACFDLTPLSSPLMTFYYHMYGSSMGTLYLEASSDGGATWEELWFMDGNQGNAWLFENSVDLSAYTTAQTHIRFRAITGDGYYSDIAIDNIVIREGDPVIAVDPLSISPNMGPLDGHNAVTILGVGFGSMQGTGAVTFDDITALLVTNWTDARIDCIVPPHTAGAVDVVVTHDNGQSGIMALGYVYEPVISVSTIYVSDDVPIDLIDYSTILSELEVFESVSITDVNLGLSITHTNDSDLDVFLVGTDGTRVELTTHNGDSGENFNNTIFDDEALIPITSGVAPFTGSYRPEGLLSGFDGLDSSGTWALEVSDSEPSDQGALNSWLLTITSYFNDIDSDSDSLPDDFEVLHGLNQNIDDAFADLDDDGYCNIREYLGFSLPGASANIPYYPISENPDEDTDGLDLTTLTDETGRYDCRDTTPCSFDIDDDGDVDEIDFIFFLEDYGRAR